MSIYETPNEITAWKDSFKSFLFKLAEEHPETLKAVREGCFDDSDWGRLIDEIRSKSHLRPSSVEPQILRRDAW